MAISAEILKEFEMNGYVESSLEGKVAIITGAASGIGAATARLFNHAGARALLVDQNSRSLESLAAELGGDTSYSVADVSTPEGVQAYVKEARDRFGGIDILVSNAGIISRTAPIAETSVEDFDRVIAVNLRSMFLGLKYVLPELEARGGGSVVMTASTAALRGGFGTAPYVTSKHGVLGLMRVAATEYSGKNIRINAVNPGPTDTNMIAEVTSERAGQAAGRSSSAEVKEGLRLRLPMQRYGRAEEIGRMIMFLASDAASFCTGGYYVVDGGMTGGP